MTGFVDFVLMLSANHNNRDTGSVFEVIFVHTGSAGPTSQVVPSTQGRNVLTSIVHDELSVSTSDWDGLADSLLVDGAGIEDTGLAEACEKVEGFTSLMNGVAFSEVEVLPIWTGGIQPAGTIDISVS